MVSLPMKGLLIHYFPDDQRLLLEHPLDNFWVVLCIFVTHKWIRASVSLLPSIASEEVPSHIQLFTCLQLLTAYGLCSGGCRKPARALDVSPSLTQGRQRGDSG